MTSKLVIIGSNSIHCKRFIQGVLDNSNYKIAIITNLQMPEFADLKQYQVNFALSNIKAKKQIAEILNVEKPEIVHIHQANSYAWHSLRAVRSLQSKPKTILTAWGSDVLLLPKESRILARIVRYSLLNADIITSDSLYMSGVINQLLTGVTKPIHTINFGIQDLPLKQDVSNKKKLILSNRLHKPLYRVDKIISAFAVLINNELIDADYQLIVAAGGEETDNLVKLAKKLGIEGKVLFTGMIPYKELVEYYKIAKIFVSVPESDGTASSLLEAMAYGCVPVLSNLPANLEWVINDYNGFISVNINELQFEIIKAVKLIENSATYQHLYDFNYRLIENKATLASNINKFIELYQ